MNECYKPFLVDGKIMLSYKSPIIGKKVMVIFVMEKITIATALPV